MPKLGIFLACLASFLACIQAVEAHGYPYRGDRHQRKQLIIDTDMLNFADDPPAIGLANILMNKNEVQILGIASTISSRYAAPAIDAINTFYNHPAIPLAMQKPVDNSTIDPNYPQYHDYLTGLTTLFPQDTHDGTNTTSPVLLYRHLLANAPSHSITIANIGFHDNLYHLLHSAPDAISPLSGADLVKAKVAELVVQGNPTGESFNFVEHNVEFAKFVLTHWPGVVTFVPDEVGENVWTGARLTTETDPETNPVAYAFATAIGVNITHQSWDATAMYYALRGLEDVYYLEREKGEIYFFENGTAGWNFTAPSRLQRSLGIRGDNATLAKRIEDLLVLDTAY